MRRTPKHEDRKQFLATAKLKAERNYRRRHGGRDAYMAVAMKHARIDWDRRARAERRRQAKTRNIDNLLHEPEAPDLNSIFDAFDTAMSMLAKLPERERALMTLMFVNGYSRTEVATTLDISPQAVSKRREHALSRLRQSIK